MSDDMSDDIVARLRVLNHHAKKLAENESLDDLHREAFTRCENLTWEAADEIEHLRCDIWGTYPSQPTPLNRAARRLCVPMHWLREEIDAGRIPALVAGRATLVHVPTVAAIIAQRAKAGKAVEHE